MRQAFAPAEDAGSRWQKLIVRVVEQGQAAGELRTDTPAPLLESLLSSVSMTTLYYWLCYPVGGPAVCGTALDFPLLDGLRTRLDLVLDGIAAKGGRA